MIIAVDGPAASGKGTLARRLAARYGLAHLDTGSIYRAAAMHAIEADGDPADPAVAEAAARRVTPADLADERLRGEMVGQAASVVAAIPVVRAVLLDFQRDFARNPPGGANGAVLDGRDIGTVICPDAEVKLFITADIAARAQRRWRELREGGLAAIYDRVLQDLEQRDARDKQRRTAPLVAAPDAFVLDTTALDADAAFAAAVAHVETTLARKRA
jgi:cytidylate kinase